MAWRWDQGRLPYFQFSTIRRISQVLQGLNGSEMKPGKDPVKPALKATTGLPFLPDSNDYPAWRNYGRIFELELLATKVEGKLATTEICSQVASGALGADDYFRLIIRRLYLPSPVFDDLTRALRASSHCALFCASSSPAQQRGMSPPSRRAMYSTSWLLPQYVAMSPSRPLLR